MPLVPVPAREAEVPRDGYGRPLVVPESGGKPIPLTRTTTYIDCIEDKSNLIDWGKRQVLLGAAAKPTLLEAVRDLDPEDAGYKKTLSAYAEAALDASGANDKREKGTSLHAISEVVDEGKPAPEGLSEKDMLDMAAYQLAVSDLTMEAMEQFVVCSEVQVGGTYDRRLRYTGPGPVVRNKPVVFNNTPMIGDLKTGSVQYGALKIAAQLAIYSRAKSYDFSRFPVDTTDKKAFAAWKKTVVPEEEAALAYSPMEVNQDWGLVIHLPSGSGECELYWADLNLGWEMALLAKTIRAARKRKGALLPVLSV